MLYDQVVERGMKMRMVKGVKTVVTPQAPVVGHPCEVAWCRIYMPVVVSCNCPVSAHLQVWKGHVGVECVVQTLLNSWHCHLLHSEPSALRRKKLPQLQVNKWMLLLLRYVA